MTLESAPETTPEPTATALAIRDYTAPSIRQPNGRFLPGHSIGQPRKFSLEEIEQEADLLIEYAMKPDTLVLANHFALRGYVYEDIHHWCKLSPRFDKAVKISKQFVGARRETEGLKRNLDSGIVRSTLANYDPEYRQMLREQASRVDVSQSKEGISISVTNYQSTAD